MTATQQRTAMQQPVHARESTAPQLDRAAPWQPTVSPEYRAAPAGTQGAENRGRTPLAVVPAPVRRTGRGFVALCVGWYWLTSRRARALAFFRWLHGERRGRERHPPGAVAEPVQDNDRR